MMLKYKTYFTKFRVSLRRCSLHKRFHEIFCKQKYVVATFLNCHSKLLPFPKFGTSQVQDVPSLSTVSAREAREEMKKMMDACPLSPYSEPGNSDANSPTVPKPNCGSKALSAHGEMFTCYPRNQVVTESTKNAACTGTHPLMNYQMNFVQGPILGENATSSVDCPSSSRQISFIRKCR